MRSIPSIGLAALLGCHSDEGRHPRADAREETGDDLVHAAVTPHGVVRCADPAARAEEGWWRRVETTHPDLSDAWTWGGGAIVADLGGDGLLELVAPFERGLQLFEGDGVTPIVAAPRAFEAIDASFASGGTVVDYDGDGDLDLYVTRITGAPAPPEADGRNLLLRNDGGTFTDVTAAAGVDACDPDRCYRSMASSWADYDLDGDLDLWVGNYGFADETPGLETVDFQPGEPDFLYRNEGDGTFTDVSDVLPPELHQGYTYGGGFHDLDGDGDPDLYTVNDFGQNWPNRVLWNEGGTLVFYPDDASGLVRNMTGMGLAVGDLDGNGWLDLMVPEWRKNTLLEGIPELGVWLDTTAARGIDLAPGDARVGWGSEFADLDNDGDLDLLVQYGYLSSDKGELWANDLRQPDAIYLNEPDGRGSFHLVDRAAELGVVDGGDQRGAVVADLNRDGWLDVAKRALTVVDTLDVSRCGAEGWLVVHPRQPGTLNTFAVGARVEVEAGALTATRHVLAGGTGYASSGPPEVHFGLGPVDRVDRLRITWPDGAVSEVTDLEARQQVTVVRP